MVFRTQGRFSGIQENGSADGAPHERAGHEVLGKDDDLGLKRGCFLDEAFGYVDLDWRKYVEIDARYYRATEVDLLLGDASKAKEELGWEPTVRFAELVRLMVDHDRERRQTEEHYV